MIEISQITLSNFEKFIRLLPSQPNNPDCIWFGASINDVPCGILLSSKNPDNKETLNLNYLFVQPAIRREGIATSLFDEFIKYCKENGYKKFIFNSVVEKEPLNEINSFLKSYGYNPTKVVANIYTFNDPKSILDSNLIKQIIPSNVNPPKGIEILPLDEVDTKLIDHVNERTGIDFPNYYALFPTDHCSNLKHKNTYVAVANGKEVIGWLTALDAFGESIYYKTFYVKEEYRKLAVGFFLISACVKKHAEKFRNVPALCGISLKNPDAEKFNSIYFQDAKKIVKYEFLLEEEI